MSYNTDKHILYTKWSMMICDVLFLVVFMCNYLECGRDVDEKAC